MTRRRALEREDDNTPRITGADGEDRDEDQDRIRRPTAVPGLIGGESAIAQLAKRALNRLRVEGRHEPEGLERKLAMSAGQSLRRGYAYGVNAAVHSGPTLTRRKPTTDMLSLVVMATLIFVIVAVASDPVLAASAGRIFGTAWSDAIGFLARLVSR